jgi:arylamine N-acetyltransferase
LNPEEVFEALGLPPPASPGAGSLDLVFKAFVERVPFESASKIVRDRDVREREDKRREPELFWEDFVERGAGGTCFARTAAFGQLLGAIGFRAEPVLGAISAPESHAALLVSTPGGPVLADVGYPLPELLDLRSGQRDTAIGSLAVSRQDERLRIDFASGPDRGRSIEIDLRPAEPPRWKRAWERTFEPGSLFLRTVVLRRVQGHRVVRFAEGEVQILDAHSRTRIPLAGPDRAARLADLFEMESDLVARALSIAGDPEPALASARIEAYGEPEDAAGLLRYLSTPDGYVRWAAGIGEAAVTERTRNGFRVRLRGADGGEVEERVTVASDRLSVERSAGLLRTGLALERPEDLAPRLVRFAELPGPRVEFLRVDTGRGRIAGLLAMDLLAAERVYRNAREGC